MPNSFQPPPGTRDFYPQEMALRRHIEDIWRRVSLRHGFVEVDGPTFEYLDLYKVKSGDEIVSQLFHFESREDKEGKSESFALRPEFTPTIARMIAARANALPRPIKWFSIPRCYRAERKQKGRLKEFFQWNVDMFGGETPEQRRQFDLEVAALCLDCLREFGLGPDDVQLRWNDRLLAEQLFALAGVPRERLAVAFNLQDHIAKWTDVQRQKMYEQNGMGPGEIAFFERLAGGGDPLTPGFWQGVGALDTQNQPADVIANSIAATRQQTVEALSLMGLAGYARYDAAIVRGLAYYTGFVWEIVAAKGSHRAVAGGGRYDRLIEMFGGPSLPATGFGMGDVVLANLLEELGKLPKTLGTAPDVFVVNGLPTSDEATKIVGQLRGAKLAVITSYKSTKNIGKLLTDAANSGDRFALILGPAEFAQGKVKVKNLATREEKECSLDQSVDVLIAMCAT